MREPSASSTRILFMSLPEIDFTNDSEPYLGKRAWAEISNFRGSEVTIICLGHISKVVRRSQMTERRPAFLFLLISQANFSDFGILM